MRPALYASVAWVCHVGAVHLALAFLWVALWQVLIAQGWEKAHFYVAVAGRLTYTDAVIVANFRYCVLWTGAGQHVGLQCGEVVPPITYL